MLNRRREPSVMPAETLSTKTCNFTLNRVENITWIKWKSSGKWYNCATFISNKLKLFRRKQKYWFHGKQSAWKFIGPRTLKQYLTHCASWNCYENIIPPETEREMGWNYKNWILSMLILRTAEERNKQHVYQCDFHRYHKILHFLLNHKSWGTHAYCAQFTCA
jgi:hypothetical protein